MKKGLYVLLFTTFSVFSQDLPSSAIEEFQKNLMAYKIKYLGYDSFCLDNFKYQVGDIFLSDGEKYIFDYYPAKYDYPTDNLDFYVIYNNYYVKSEINSKTDKKITYTHGKGYSNILSSKFLIGITKSDKLIYIAGSIFKNCISQDFNIDVNDVVSFNNFLKLKLYNYEIDKIELRKKRRRYLLFSAYSKSLQQEIYIKVNSKDFDDLQVKIVESGWTEEGNYRWIKKKR